MAKESININDGASERLNNMSRHFFFFIIILTLMNIRHAIFIYYAISFLDGYIVNVFPQFSRKLDAFNSRHLATGLPRDEVAPPDVFLPLFVTSLLERSVNDKLEPGGSDESRNFCPCAASGRVSSREEKKRRGGGKKTSRPGGLSRFIRGRRKRYAFIIRLLRYSRPEEKCVRRKGTDRRQLMSRGGFFYGRA